MQKKRLFTFISVLVVLSMVLAACGAPAATEAPKQEAPQQEAPKQEAPKEEAPKEEAKPAAEGEVYVGFVPPALTSPFHVAMVDGATARAKELGWKLDVQAPASEGDNQAFVSTVQQLLEKGVKAMSINPINTDSAITAVKAANEKGVPILAHNFITPFSEGKVVTYIGYDQWGGAEKLAKTTCELIAKKYNTTPDQTKGKVFILLGIESIFSHRRTGGFKAGLAKYCPNVQVVGEQTAEWLRTKGQEVAAIALQKNPDIDVFYGNSDEMAIGAALAAEQAGLVINKDFFAVGIDGNQPTLDLLKQGKFSATLGVDPYRMGVTVIDTMAKVLKGEKTPEILLTPSVVVTPENLEDYLAGKLWTEPQAGFPELDNDKPTVPEEEAKPAAAAPAAGAVKELKIIWAEWDPSNYLQQLVNDYEKETGIKVTVVQEPWGSFADRVFTEFAGKGASYDLVVGDSQWLGQGATQGHYVELTDIFMTELNGKNFTPATVKFYAEYPAGSGRYWAVPTEGDAIGWSYRKDLFENPDEKAAFKAKYGYELDVPKTLDQLRDIAEFFTRPDKNLYGVAIYTQKDYDGLVMGIEQVLWNFGGDWGNYETYQVDGIVNSPESVKAIEFYKELYKYAPPGSSNDFFAESLNHYTSGEVAMAMNYFAFFPGLANPATNKYADVTGFFSNPEGPKGRYTSLGGQGMSIVSYISPERQAAAKEFLKWFTKDEVQKKWAELGGYTCNAKVLETEEFLNNTPYNRAFMESMGMVKDFWNIPIYVELLNVAKTELHNYIVGNEGTAQGALDAIAEQWTTLLKDNGYLK